MNPTIYLGIGGTGVKTLAHIKHQFEKEYGVGNIPQEIAFVGIDADRWIDNSFCTDYIDLFQTPSSIAQYYNAGTQKGQFQWMHEVNKEKIPGILGIGQPANTVRTSGRIIADYHIPYIKGRLSEVIRHLQHVSMQRVVDIYMVNSLVGSIGSGAFISVAVVIKQMYGNTVNLFGFGVTHGVFIETAVGIPSVWNSLKKNGMSSIIDLDYIFTASQSKPIYFEVGGETIAITESVFDNFFVVDNKSDSGFVIEKIEELCEMLGLALYSFGIDSCFVSVSHHLSYKMGYHDVQNKIGWAQGLGVCEVVFKGRELAQIYAHKAATVLIREMRRKEADIQDRVLPWIEEVGLREDDEAEIHQLITSTCSQKAIDKLRLPDVNQGNSDEANKQECQRYLTNLTQFPSDSYIATLLDGFRTKLDEKVQALLKENAGVGNAIRFVKLFVAYCEEFRRKMDSDLVLLTRQKVDRKEEFEKKAYNNYIAEKYGLLTIRRAEKNQMLLEDLVGYPAREILKLSYEIKRREVASSIYNALLAQAYSLCNRLEHLDGNLKLLGVSLERDCINMETRNSASVFEYDISIKERRNMKVDDADVVATSFIATLGEQSLLDIDYHTLLEKMLAYTENLPQAKAYKNANLSQIINELSDEEYNALKMEIERRSARWFRVDSKGMETNMGKLVADAIIKDRIGLCPIESEVKYRISCRLEDDKDHFWQIYYIPIYSENTKQRMIITSIDASVIPYCLGFIDDVAMKHYVQLIEMCKTSQAVFNPHIDKGWFDKMQEEGFSLKPDSVPFNENQIE